MKKGGNIFKILIVILIVAILGYALVSSGAFEYLKSREKLEALGRALLRISSMADLVNWLNQQENS